MTIGFFTSETFLSAFGGIPSSSARPTSWRTRLPGAFALSASEEALRAAAPLVIELFEKSRKLCTDYLERAYIPHAPQTGED